jgi:hypothetical protein
MELNVKKEVLAGRRWLLALVIALAMATSVAADSGSERLLELLHEFMAGASNNDAEVHDRFWDDELVYTSSGGARFGKPEIMSGLRGPAGPGGIEYTAEEIDIRMHGEVGVITFRLVATRADQERQEYFNTGVFRMRDGHWRAVAWQATRVGEAAPE